MVLAGGGLDIPLRMRASFSGHPQMNATDSRQSVFLILKPCREGHMPELQHEPLGFGP